MAPEPVPLPHGPRAARLNLDISSREKIFQRQLKTLKPDDAAPEKFCDLSLQIVVVCEGLL